jgi:ElaB/YqjD/DUF883 family membrane-anchored ribosome-binding protein
MTHNSGTWDGGDIGDAVESTLDDVTGNLKHKGRELRRKAVDRLEDGRAAAADGLKGAAQGLHRRADALTSGAERVSAVTHRVADKVESASRYVRDRDSRDMLADVEAVVRRHPSKAILAALGVGYLAGRAFGGDE